MVLGFSIVVDKNQAQTLICLLLLACLYWIGAEVLLIFLTKIEFQYLLDYLHPMSNMMNLD